MTTTPPINVDVSEKRLYLFSLRQIAILVPTSVLALLMLFGPLFSDWSVRFLLAITILSFGCAVAYLPFDGKHFEAWLVEVFAFTGRRRYFVHRAFKPVDHGPKIRVATPRSPDPSVAPRATPEPAEPAPTAISLNVPKPRRAPSAERTATLDPYLLSINLMGLGILVGLAAYLYQSGWYQVLLHWAQL